MSVVGLHMLSQLQTLLMIAKHTDASVPFRNINVMFSGDFLQFAPVRNMALYSDVIPPITDTNDSKKQIKDKNTQRQIQYRVERALWTHVNTVITLTRQMRVEDPDFLAIQNHIHFARLSNTFLKLKRKKSIIPVKRVQLRFVSVFAFATHQCQGKTFDRILIDLIFSPERRRNEVALPYVPISRCKWLVDLVFLRDFPLLSIQIKPTQEQLSELVRLNTINDITKDLFIDYNSQFCKIPNVDVAINIQQ
ncbi:unnamed protein product [Rotaria sp. Silwood1]|nr:unnamed protein product [Rotaria sp. Silwood1]CAF3441330.1 unnamed protein product [Rotaria sp. Silwood1]CAF4974066.1 unnamed protein product [Rotaria sp. Silwood1]